MTFIRFTSSMLAMWTFNFISCIFSQPVDCGVIVWQIIPMSCTVCNVYTDSTTSLQNSSIIWCGKTVAGDVTIQDGVVSSAAADAVACDVAGVSKGCGRWGERPRVGGSTGGYVPGYTATVCGAGGAGILLLLYKEKTPAKTTDTRRRNYQRFAQSVLRILSKGIVLKCML